MNTPKLASLADVLGGSARALAATPVPPEREAAVLAAMRAAQAARPGPAAPGRWHQRWFRGLRQSLSKGLRPLAWSGAASCGVLLLGATFLLLQEPPVPPEETLARGSGFLPLVSSERWARYLSDSTKTPSHAWVVATDMPRERLALLGLPYDPGQAGDSVRAELLMHPSGDVLAVRFVR
eukprot:Opistho-2@34230